MSRKRTKRIHGDVYDRRGVDMVEKQRRKVNRQHQGFTLAELLIVVAIIAVLVAISIPIFTTQLEKSREATDLANVRSAYAEVMMAAIIGDTNAIYTVDSSAIFQSDGTYQIIVQPLKQKKDGWQMDTTNLNIGGVMASDSVHWHGIPKAGGSCTIRFTNEEVHIYWSRDGSDDTLNNQPTDTPNGTPDNNPTNKPDNSNSSGNGENTGTVNGTDISIKNTVPFVVDKNGVTLTAGTVYSYLGNYYVCIADTSAGANWDSYESVIPNENKWPYVQLVSNPTVLTKDQLDYTDDAVGHFNGIKQGTLYKSSNGTLYIMKCDYDNGNWCKSPEAELGNWQKITQ